MSKKIFLAVAGFLSALLFVCKSSGQKMYHEMYRPQIHFSSKTNWINDPNGMVYINGVYHLYFQHNPYSSVWGPMHWGHATSNDLVHWKQQPIALYPDSLGTIFSGSAVVDKNNTSGFGTNGKAPLVAIFTQHNTEEEKAGRNDFQNQCIAYSLNDGMTWTKYSGNPVIKNPGFRDFRDPKVMWYEPQKKWVMSLAVKDNITFYSSPDLKSWTRESDFGEGRGAHGGGWECPDLIALDDNGKQRWVLIVSLNPGGPNAGSATQYFVGDFDGKTFTSDQKETQWIDYGPDNYAGVTWSNTAKRKIFIGWMSNWLYANLVPTERWRSAMTTARELKIKHVANNIFVTSTPVTEMKVIQSAAIIKENIIVSKNIDITGKTRKAIFPCRLNLDLKQAKDFSVILLNDMNEEVIIGYNKTDNKYYIDRTKSGKTDFQKDFAAKHTAPRLTDNAAINLSIIVDASSVELFADEGLTNMTELVFPNKPFTHIRLRSADNVTITKMEYISLKNTWK